MLSGTGGSGGGNADMESYNNDAMKNYNEKVLEACPNCARTFLPDRLIVHLRSCGGGGKGGAKDVKSSTMQTPPSGGIGGGGGGGIGGSNNNSMSPNKTFKKPKTLMCYIW